MSHRNTAKRTTITTRKKTAIHGSIACIERCIETAILQNFFPQTHTAVYVTHSNF